MKRVFVYATCQGGILQDILMRNSSFMSEYGSLLGELNYPYIKDKIIFVDDEKNRGALANADLFIYQPLSDIYGQNSTNHIMKFLKPSCFRVAIPYVVNDSLWPISRVILRDLGTEHWGVDSDSAVTRNIEVIDSLLKDGVPNDKILYMYDNDLIDWNYDARYRAILRYLRYNETMTDVKVSDFMEDNLKDERLFLYYSHGTLFLYLYMANEICKILALGAFDGDTDEVIASRGVLKDPHLGFPTSSVNHFGFKFTTTQEREEADNFYRDIIVTYINGR